MVVWFDGFIVEMVFNHEAIKHINHLVTYAKLTIVLKVSLDSFKTL